MRVLMTTDTLGGVFTYSMQLIRALRDEDVEVVLATFGRRMSVDQRRRAIAAGATDLDDTGLALEWMPDPWDELSEAEHRLLALERRERPDLVHLNAFAHGGAPFAAPVLVVGHSCVWSWWEAVHGETPPAPWDRYRALVREGLSGADAVVAPSQTMLGSLQRWYGPLPARSVAIHNGIGHGAPAAAAVAKQPLVLSAGRLWDDAKNVVALARVAQRPALRDRVLLAGEGA
ncbi:MAG: glycosyltransferase family 4 protein, partial [Solirubrobacteraceae bacterium]